MFSAGIYAENSGRIVKKRGICKNTRRIRVIREIWEIRESLETLGKSGNYVISLISGPYEKIETVKLLGVVSTTGPVPIRWKIGGRV